MRVYLQEFFQKFDYPPEAREELLRAYDAVYASHAASGRFDALLKRYEADCKSEWKPMLEEAAALSADAGVHEYTGQLLMCICMTPAMKEYYRREGLAEEIWFDTVCDLKWKLMECRLVYGIWGSFVCRWFDRFFNLTRFALGRLQFELVPFEATYEKNGLSLKPDSQVINVHIPRTGGRLDPESVRRAYAQAAAFFREKYQVEPVFVCHSWLLFPRNLEVLKPESNLYKFISAFDLVEHGESEDYGEAWRLFDTMYQGDVNLLPQDTSFRRTYADWIRKGEKMGWGYGVYDAR